MSGTSRNGLQQFLNTTTQNDLQPNRRTGMIDPEAITEAKRALGRQLAAYRDTAGLNQRQLAPLIHYGRSTIANVETGRQTCSRTFWERCDQALETDGVLIRAYEDLTALIRAQQAEVARRMDEERSSRLSQLTAAAGPTGHLGPENPDTVIVSIRLDGREVVVSLDRRVLLQAGVGTFLEAFALGQQVDAMHSVVQQTGPATRLTMTSSAHVDEILAHLRKQWHALVRTDNLLGPRFALTGVLSQIAIVEALLSALRDVHRLKTIRLGARYAESAAWLYEDSGHLPQARYWTSRAMEWAYEADDKRMLAWTVFRRSQQAAATHDVAQVIGLAQAARRDEEQLATPTRAAIRVQEAYGHALDGNEQDSQRLLDEAHDWAASDTVGDARGGHGSYCTPSYIEIQRACCWLATGHAKKAIALYENGLRTLPVVYYRNRAAALSQLAVAYLADGQLEQAASTAHVALPVARNTGSRRILEEIKGISAQLAPHRRLQGVAALIDDLSSEDA
jgi:tetratricopeptide (TPR) repeat protein